MFGVWDLCDLDPMYIFAWEGSVRSTVVDIRNVHVIVCGIYMI